MTRRSVLGLVDLPPRRDPLLGLLLVEQVLVQRVARIEGDTTRMVGAVTTHSNSQPWRIQLRERVLLGLLTAAVLWLLPALIRRSRRAYRGKPTWHGVLWDRPWQRDLVWWLFAGAGLLVLGGLIGATSSTSSGSGGPGLPDTTIETVVGSYAMVLPALLRVVPLLALLALALWIFRLIFRLLGGERPWRRASGP